MALTPLHITIDNLACEELYGSPTLSLSRFGDPSGTRTIHCEWSLFSNIANALLSDGDAAKHPYASYLVCNGIDINQARGPGEVVYEGASGIRSRYTKCVFTATYGPRRQAGKSRIAEERISFSGESLVVPGHSYQWNEKLGGGDSTVKGQVIPEDLGKVVTVGERELVLPRVIGFTTAANEGFIGKINESEWDGFSAGTLLFDGYTAERIYIPETGDRALAAHRITYKFKYRYPPWNYAWSRKDQAWVNTTPPIYESTTFTQG